MPENPIAAALAGGKDPDAAVHQEALRHAVMRAITCPFTNKVLDVKMAVLVDYTKSGGTNSGMTIMHADAFDAVGEAELRSALATKEQHTPEKIVITDGRTLDW